MPVFIRKLSPLTPYIYPMKRAFAFFFTCFLALFAFAHEFWLSPQRFFYRVRETAHISFKVGENFMGENWGGNNEKVNHLVHFTPSGETIELSGSISGNKGDSLALPLQEAGTHMVTFVSTNSFIHLDADKFNAYLAEDGLDAVARYRKEHGEEQTDGKEYYQRSVKTIIQVGDKRTDLCAERTGLPLDIVPEINPYSLPEFISRSGLPKVNFKVYLYGKPLRDALVKVWYSPPGKSVKVEALKTNNNGIITTERHPGRFMVSCVHMIRNTADTVANWQSYWASVTFEYSQFFPSK